MTTNVTEIDLSQTELRAELTAAKEQYVADLAARGVQVAVTAKRRGAVEVAGHRFTRVVAVFAGIGHRVAAERQDTGAALGRASRSVTASVGYRRIVEARRFGVPEGTLAREYC